MYDAKEARKWYNQQQKGLGKTFTEDVKNTISSVEQNPYFGSVKYNNIQTAACKTFPYALHYEIDETNNIVRIVAVFHFSRKPLWEEDD
jgi:mRNA-degrading endonuclease RelE of RelBE toxin-antitoxin system